MVCSISNAKRRAALLAVAALGLVVVLAGCSKADQPVSEGLPAWTDEASLVAQAHEVADRFNARDYDAVASQLAEGGATVEQFQQSFDEVLDAYGAFKNYGEASFLQGESKGRSYATVIQKAEYENGSGEFRISFFEDGSLAGFYFLKG